MLLCIFFKWLCQMHFGQCTVKFFHNIIGKLRFLGYYEKFDSILLEKASEFQILRIAYL